MEYGLWNFHGGFWTGSNNGFPPVEGISRNFYTAVNNEIESPTFHITTPGNGSSQNLLPSPSGTPPCPTTIRTNLEFLSMKHGRGPPMMMPGHQDDLLQSVALESVPMASDMMTEQNSMDSMALTDSSMPPLLSHQQNHYSNHSNNSSSSSTTSTTTTTTRNSHHQNNHPNNNNHITTSTNCNNNNINNNNNNNNNIKNAEDKNDQNESDNHNPTEMGKGEKNKLRQRDDEIWEDISGTNIKLENNTDIDYLFHQSYQHPMYGMVFSKMSSNKREPVVVSDETDEEEDELDNGGSQMGAIDNVQNANPPLSNGSPLMHSVSNATSVNFSKNGYECGECGLVAETRPGLKKHIAVFHPTPNPDLRLNNVFLKKIPNSSKCPMSSCRFRTSERTEMEAHMARHVAGEYKLNQKKRAGPLTPQRVRYEREEYRCQICAYSCTVEKAFHKHLKIHSVGRQMNQIKISCVICGKDRSSEVDMNKHMKKHRDDRYFCCDICIFKTVQLKKLIQHRRMHTGEKPHLCPHCSYRSARRDNLRSHVRRVHKKDNLFCDTFSPRGLLIAENPVNPLVVSTTGTATTTTTTTTAAAVVPVSSGPLAAQMPALVE